MIKMYEKGKLTPLLINDEDKFPNDLIIGKPRGQGLKIEAQKPGKIIFCAGGTGFYPFMDIIDLLFKQKVLEEDLVDDNIKRQILEKNPVLNNPILK